MTPLVSIIIPCHNAAPWLAATLESAIAQTWPTVEIIMVDDGSTDESPSIARRFNHPQLKVITQPNTGAAAARNHALRLARGDFIQYLDADDLLAPDKIALQLTRLAGAPRSVCAGPWGRFLTAPADAVFAPEENWRDLSAVDWLCLNFAGRGMMPPAAWLTARSLLDAAGPWDESLSLNDDGEYYTRVLLASNGVLFCPDAKSFYRSGLPGSLSRTRSRRAWDSAFRSQDACARHLLAVETSPRTRRACADLFMRLAHAAYPDCPDVAAQSEARAAAHGGSTLRPGGGACFRALARLFGWKTARRLQQLANRPTP
ncbi:MAG: glycosyltransferase family 2 protein [Opitutaceae bacterium]|nr:glycosyltransferase family 2 protein [Opitutaceae bacterium]